MIFLLISNIFLLISSLSIYPYKVLNTKQFNFLYPILFSSFFIFCSLYIIKLLYIFGNSSIWLYFYLVVIFICFLIGIRKIKKIPLEKKILIFSLLFSAISCSGYTLFGDTIDYEIQGAKLLGFGGHNYGNYILDLRHGNSPLSYNFASLFVFSKLWPYSYPILSSLLMFKLIYILTVLTFIKNNLSKNFSLTILMIIIYILYTGQQTGLSQEFLTYYLTIFMFLTIYINNDYLKKMIFPTIFFGISHKFTLILLLLFYFIKKNKKLFIIFILSCFLIIPTLLINYINTKCFIYPMPLTCLDPNAKIEIEKIHSFAKLTFLNSEEFNIYNIFLLIKNMLQFKIKTETLGSVLYYLFILSCIILPFYFKKFEKNKKVILCFAILLFIFGIPVHFYPSYNLVPLLVIISITLTSIIISNKLLNKIHAYFTNIKFIFYFKTFFLLLIIGFEIIQLNKFDKINSSYFNNEIKFEKSLLSRIFLPYGVPFFSTTINISNMNNQKVYVSKYNGPCWDAPIPCYRK